MIDRSQSLLTVKNYNGVSMFHLMVRTKFPKLVEYFLTNEPYKSEITNKSWITGNKDLGYVVLVKITNIITGTN